MNLAHIHIVLNHLPTLGTLVGTAWLFFAMTRKNVAGQRNSLVLLLVMALLALPTYLSGNAAQVILQSRGAVPRSLINAHQDAAMLALVFITATGAFAWLGLWGSGASRGRRSGTWHWFSDCPWRLRG